MAPEDELIDKRIVERSIARGKVDAAAHRKLLEELPDQAHNVWQPDDGGESRVSEAVPTKPELPALGDD